MLVMEMSNKKQQIPAIRFNGFTDAWEQRKLEELVSKAIDNRGKTPPTLEQGVYPLLEIASIGGYFPDYSKVIKYVDADTYNTWFRAHLKEKDILFSTVGNTGLATLMDNFEGATVAQNIVGFRAKKSIVPEFLLQMFKLPSNLKKVKRIEMGAVQSSVKVSQLIHVEYYIPTSKDEQTKIGTFLKQLDNTIALHQRQLGNYKELKKAMLQKMFPRDGESVPEVRFAGFTEAWEQRKLDDVSEKVTEKNKNRKVTETLTNSAEYGIISQSDFFDKDISNINNIDGYYVVRPDDFVYNPRISNYAPVGPIKRNNLNKIGVMSPLYYVFRIKDIDPSFLEKYFDTAYWHMFMKLNGDSGARADRFAIKDSVFKQMPIPYPSIEEQVKLGNFFKQLDDTIALHQQKGTDYQQLKKTMLQQMFV